MKLTHLAVGILGACLSLSSFAGTVSISPNVTLLAIDGHKVASSVFSRDKSFEASANNEHQVVLRVSSIIRAGGSERKLYESQPIIIKFKGSDTNLMLKAPTIRTEREANVFDHSPLITLVQENGRAIRSTQDILVQKGIFPNSRLAENLASYNSSDSKAAVTSFATVSIPGMMSTDGYNNREATVTVRGKNVPEQQLQYWFQKADKATRTRFIKWATGK